MGWRATWGERRTRTHGGLPGPRWRLFLVPPPLRGPSQGRDRGFLRTVRKVRERKSILGRRSAFEKDGEEQKEAPRNGIDLDINPGWLPPPPEPRLGAGPGAGRAKPGQLQGAVSRGRPTRARGPDAAPRKRSFPVANRSLCPESGALRASLCQARRQDALGARRLSEAAEPPVPGQARPGARGSGPRSPWSVPRTPTAAPEPCSRPEFAFF